MNVTRVEIMDIPPETAKALLDRNSGNRKLSEPTVKKYTLEMLRGTFKTTNNGIGVDSEGNLIDGQHRLAAIVRSGTTQRIVVGHYDSIGTAMGVPIDIGVKRGLHDFTGVSSSHARLISFLLRDLYVSSRIEGLEYKASLLKNNSALMGAIEIVLEASKANRRGVDAAVKSAFVIAELMGKGNCKVLKNIVRLSEMGDLEQRILRGLARDISIDTGENGRRARFSITLGHILGSARITEDRRKEILETSRSIIMGIVDKEQEKAERSLN